MNLYTYPQESPLQRNGCGEACRITRLNLGKWVFTSIQDGLCRIRARYLESRKGGGSQSGDKEYDILHELRVCCPSVRPSVASVSSDCGTEVQDAFPPRHDDDVKMQWQWRRRSRSWTGGEEGRGEECFQSARGPGLKLIPWA